MARSPDDRFVTDPIPSKDDGQPTEYEKNVARVLDDAPPSPPAEQA